MVILPLYKFTTLAKNMKTNNTSLLIAKPRFTKAQMKVAQKTLNDLEKQSDEDFLYRAKLSRGEKKPPRKKTRHLESQIQKSFVQWSAYFPCGTGKLADYLIAIPNGGGRSKIEASILKAEGVKAGVSDMFLAYPANGFNGLWLEFKTQEKLSKVSEKQQNWLDLMQSVGYKTGVPRSLEEAIKMVQDYLSPVKINF